MKSAPIPLLFPTRTVWTLALNNQITVPPAYSDQNGFFALEQDRLAAYDLSRGSQKWLVAASPQTEMAVGDALLFVAEPRAVRALRILDGSTAWTAPLADPIAVPPVWDNGWLIVSTTGSELFAFRAADGLLVWKQSLPSPAHGRAALAADRVYIPTDDGRIVALRVDTGAPVWERRLGGPGNGILALDDRIYVGSQDNFFYCLLAADGAIDWRWRTGADVIGQPVVDKQLVYFASLDNVLRALHRTSGVQRWRTSLPIRPSGGPVKAGDVLLVWGLTPSMPAYNPADGKPAGELSAGAEPAAAPHLFLPVAGAVPVVVTVTRDIAKGATVTAVTRSSEPKVLPIAPLPNLIPMTPTAAATR